MSRNVGDDVTVLLAQWRDGGAEAEAKLMECVQRELRKIAAAYLRREKKGQTIVAPTELVNDAYVKLVGRRQIPWESRTHFYGVAAQVMRRILVDHARRRRAAKRQGFGGERVTLANVAAPEPIEDIDVLGLHEALVELHALDARQATIVELRYFGGMTVDEIARFQEVSAATVKRELLTAKLFLRQRLAGP